MHVGTRSRTRVNSFFSNDFSKDNVGVHQGSVLRPLLFIIVLEAITREFQEGFQWEMLYAGGLVILGEKFEGLKGLKVNLWNTRVISSRDLHTLQTIWLISLCSMQEMCQEELFCTECSFWVHKVF